MPKGKIPNLDFRQRNYKKPKKSDFKAANPTVGSGIPQSADPTTALLLSTLLFSFHCVGVHAKISDETNTSVSKPHNRPHVKTNTQSKSQSRQASSSHNHTAPVKSAVLKQNQCLREEEIHHAHHVIKNVPRLQDAKVVVYAEKHNEDNDRNKAMVFRVLSTPTVKGAEELTRDTILAEGIPRDKKFLCNKLLNCFYPAHDGFAPRSVTQLLPDKPEQDKQKTEAQICGKELNTNKAPVFFAFRIDPRFNCKGWDAVQAGKDSDVLYQKMEACEALKLKFGAEGEMRTLLLQYANNAINDDMFINTMLVHSNAFLSEIRKHRNLLPDNIASDIRNLENSISNTRKNFKQEVVKQRKLINSILQKASNALADELENAFKDPNSGANVEVRNKEMIHSIKELEEEKGKIFIASGKRHLISEEDEAIVQDGNDLPPPKPGSEQYELRSYLASTKYAIVLPKKRQGIRT